MLTVRRISAASSQRRFRCAHASICRPSCCSSSSFVLVIAAVGGRLVGAVAAIVASLLVNWFFVEPYNTLTIAEPENVIALVVFVAVAVAVGSLVDTASRRSLEARARPPGGRSARRGRRPASPPIRSGSATGRAHLRSTFGLDGVRLDARIDSNGRIALAEAGDIHSPASATLTLSSGLKGGRDDESTLEVFGRALSADDQRLLRVLADQLAVAIDNQDLAGRPLRQRSGRHRRRADRAAAGGVARPAHAARVDQGDGLGPARPDRDVDRRSARRGSAHRRGGDRPAQPTRRQPARRQPAADRRAGRRTSNRPARRDRRGGAAQRERGRQCGPRRDPVRDIRWCCAIRRCSNAASPTSSATRCATVRATNRVRIEAAEVGGRDPPPRRRSWRRDRCQTAARWWRRSSDSATRRNGDGVGLGLSIAQGFVDAMNGVADPRRHTWRRAHRDHCIAQGCGRTIA